MGKNTEFQLVLHINPQHCRSIAYFSFKALKIAAVADYSENEILMASPADKNFK